MNICKFLSIVILVFNTFLLLAQPKKAEILYDKGSNVEFKNAEAINSTGLEFSPAFYQNGIVYASSRKKSGERDQNIDETYFELFYSELDRYGKPLTPREFSLQVNSHLHEGPVSFSKDGNRIYFTRNNIKKGVRKADAQGVTRLKIYEAIKGSNDWKGVREMPFNSDDFSTCHPTLSNEGDLLIFSSDMPGGFGGMDLYKVEMVDDHWSDPINLGADVNTEGHEVFPFLHRSGFLFFSSNGYVGEGGLDLYMSDLFGEEQGKVFNLGAPFNSISDDLGFILDNEGTKGYFSSDREGGKGKDDIYFFKASEGIWGRTKPPVYAVPVLILDKNGEPIDGADIHIFEKTPNGFRSGEKELFKSVLLPSPDDPNDLVFTKIQKLDKELGNADYHSSLETNIEHDFSGEKEYRILVSKKGFQSKSVAFNTYGNNQGYKLIVNLEKSSCKNLSGFIQSNQENDLSNIAINIVDEKTNEKKTVFTNAEGNFSYCLNPYSDYRISVLNENFNAKEVSLSSNEDWNNFMISVEPVVSAYAKTAIKKGAVIILENIYYDFNKSHIRSGEAEELDQLLDLMLKYPSMQIEMTAYTDTRGSKKYNSKLSLKRVESSVQYLVSRGINFNRITASGLGENDVRNHCKDGVKCSDEEHEYNRRTEVRITKVDEELNIQYKN